MTVQAGPMTDRSRLYGLPYAEILYFDMLEVIEQMDERGGEIEEYSVKPASEHLPDVGTIVDWINVWSAENGELAENVYDCFEDASGDVEVIAAFERALNVFASKITGRMADTLLATYVVTFLDGHPLITRKP